VAKLDKERSKLDAQWQAEKETISSIREKKAELEQLKVEEVQSERDGNLAGLLKLNTALSLFIK